MGRSLAPSPVAVDAGLANRSPGEALLPVLSLVGGAWAKVGVGGIEVQTMSAAITNQVYAVRRIGGEEAPPGGEGGPQRVLVRIYGHGGDEDGVELLARDDEITLGHSFTALSNVGMGPKLVALFDNGRIEEFLEGPTLRAADIRDLGTSARIAREIARVHAMELAGAGAMGGGAGAAPVLWSVLGRWTTEGLARARALSTGAAEGPGAAVAPAAGELLEEVAGQVPWLRSRLESACPGPALATRFCHNDLQYGNIMEVPGKGIVLIDFEYAGANPVGFDLANHFCEHMADYHSDEPHRLDPEMYPSPERRRAFAEEYLRASSADGEDGTWAGDGEAAAVLAEGAHRFRAASHLFWAAWGAIKAAEGAGGFDYWAYAQQRAAMYREWRAAQEGGGGS